MAAFQFAAQTYKARTSTLLGERAVNMFVERSPAAAKDQVPIFMCPGMDVFSQLGPGPIYGLHPMGDLLYVVSGGYLFSVNIDGLPTYIGQTLLGGICSITDNGSQIVMVDGESGWIYQIGGLNQVLTTTALTADTSVIVNATGTMAIGDPISIPLDIGGTHTTTIASIAYGPPNQVTIGLTDAMPNQASAGAVAIDSNVVLGQITAPAFKPANTVVYFDSYFVFDAVGTRQFFISALGDGTQYDGLDFASAQAGPDLMLAVKNYHEQLLLIKQKTIEVWYDSGAANFPFQRYDGAYIQRGAASPQAIVQEDNTILWLGEDGIFYRLNGYQPVRISTFGTEHPWSLYPTIQDATAFVVTIEGHKFISLTFPSAPATWWYDISSGADEPLWIERESWGSPWVTGNGFVPPPQPYVALGVSITSPVTVSNSTLTGIPSTYSTFVTSIWVKAPDDGTNVHGMWFSNVTDHSNAGPGVSIGIFNDQTHTPQIIVNLTDPTNALIVTASYPYASWSGWVEFLISANTATNVLQVYACVGGTDTALTSSSITWSSTNPIGDTGATWTLESASS